MTERPKRKPVPLAVQLEVALRQLATFLGCQPNELDLDHTPALGLRPVENGVHVPHQHDPAHLEWLPRPAHLLKTNGRRGESDLSLDRNADKARIAKAKRLEEQRLAEEVERRQRQLLAPKIRVVETAARKKSSWPQGRKLQSRKKKEGTSAQIKQRCAARPLFTGPEEG